MTILLNMPCDRCLNACGVNEHGSLYCKAFPDGLPFRWVWEHDPTQMAECNNGFGFVEKEVSNGK